MKERKIIEELIEMFGIQNSSSQLGTFCLHHKRRFGEGGGMWGGESKDCKGNVEQERNRLGDFGSLKLGESFEGN